MAVTISVLADEVGVTTDTLRYYERRGLLEAPARSAAGYRLYGGEAADRVRFIKSAQHAGLRLGDIRQLLEVMDRGACPCGHTTALVERRLAEVDVEIGRLVAMRRQLAKIAERSRSCTDPHQNEWWCATAITRGGDD
jgi:DNA-binding transcriptional MerR regulator